MSYHKTRYERFSSGVRPPLLGVHAAAPQRYPALLESSAPHPTAGRYDILLAGAGQTILARPFLKTLEALWQHARRTPDDHQLPFAGGWFLYLGYELAAEIEPALTLPQTSTPAAFAQRVHGAAIYDHQDATTWLIAEPGHEALIDELAAALGAAQDPAESTAAALASLEEELPDLFLRRVATAKAHI